MKEVPFWVCPNCSIIAVGVNNYVMIEKEQRYLGKVESAASSVLESRNWRSMRLCWE